MGKLKIVLLIMGIILVNSCNKNSELEIDTNNLLIGNWSNATYTNETITFKRSNTIQNNSYGISFKKTGVFVEHSSGWCGTPPLIYNDYEGNWQLQETLIKLTNQTFSNNFNWRIIALTENQLTVKRELTEQEKEHQVLIDLYNEFNLIANSTTCADANDWLYTAYGTKACGGPQGYIAYSKTIDTIDFLNKIAHYNQLEDAYNKKWGIVSTCDTPAQPIKIVCQNGRPVLKY